MTGADWHIRVVKVRGSGEDIQAIRIGDCFGIFIKKATVRLKMDTPARGKEFPVFFQENRTGQALVRTAKLGIGKSKLNFRNLPRRKERLDQFYPGSQKSNIGQIMFNGIFRSLP